MEDWKLNGRPVPGFLPFSSKGEGEGSLFAQIVFDGVGCFRQPSLEKLFGAGLEALPVFGNASILSSGVSKLMNLSFVRSFINPGFQVIIDWLNRLNFSSSY